jgi:BirA family biotin operon repressor/biotin-[acetyl-CoA-carboxylase] ligase
LIGTLQFDYEEITSTNDVARAAVAQGVSEGAVFVADHQTAGRGRRGAKWAAQPGESVLMTVVLYPQWAVSAAWKLGWIASVALIEALGELGINAACKWPNDIVVNGRKTAGILVETVSAPPREYAALVGIGVNVKQVNFDGGDEYRMPPTSLAIELAGEAPSPAAVIDSINKSLDKYYSLSLGNWDTVVSQYKISLVLGQVQNGIDPGTGDPLSGALLAVRSSDGAALLQIGPSEAKYVYPELGGSS